MQVKQVELKTADMLSINKWLHKRNKEVVHSWDLPKLAFSIPGVGYMFLRKVEGNIAMIDSTVTNPLVSAATRNRAMDALAEHVLSLGFTRFIILTEDYHTSIRALNHGFKCKQHTFLTKEV